MKNDAICKGFARIPIHSYPRSPPFEDDIATKSCGKIKDAVAKRWDDTVYGDDVVFKDVMNLKDDLKDKYSKMMNLNESEEDKMTFKDAYGYADLVFSQRFEGNKQEVNWSDHDLLEVDQTQKYGLIRPVPDELR